MLHHSIVLSLWWWRFECVGGGGRWLSRGGLTNLSLPVNVALRCAPGTPGGTIARPARLCHPAPREYHRRGFARNDLPRLPFHPCSCGSQQATSRKDDASAGACGGCRLCRCCFPPHGRGRPHPPRSVRYPNRVPHCIHNPQYQRDAGPAPTTVHSRNSLGTDQHVPGGCVGVCGCLTPLATFEWRL
jgi:hypothetical protein